MLTKVHGKVLPLEKNVSWVTPEQFGAKGDGITDDLIAITSALATRKNVKFSKTTYLVSNTIYFPAIDMDGQIIDGNNCTINANHVNAVWSAAGGGAEAVGIAVSGVHFMNMKIVGISSVDSYYNNVKSNYAFTLKDYSSITNVKVYNIGTDAFSFSGYASKGSKLFCDNIRDNAIAMRGTYNYVTDITVGHCAGDMLLMKGSHNRVEYATGKKCGVPGANPEPGFIAGGIAIFGAPVDGDDLGSYNSVGYVEVDKWAALGVGFSGVKCRVDSMKLGSCYYTDDNAQVQNSKPWVAIIRGSDSSIGSIISEGSPYGILMLSSTNCSIQKASISKATKIQLQINNTAINCVIDSITFDTYSQWGISAVGVGCVIGDMILNNCDIPLGQTAVHLSSPTTIFKNIFINGVGAGGGTGVVIEMDNNAELWNLKGNSFSGTALWVRPTGKVPRMVDLLNQSDASKPMFIISATNSCCNGWLIRNTSATGGAGTVYQEPSTTVVSTWIGCEGTLPLAQGGATLNASTDVNRFY